MKHLKMLTFVLIASFGFQCSETVHDEASMFPSGEVEYGPGDAHPDQGEFITHALANEKLSAYLNLRAEYLAEGKEIEGVYGYVLGLNKYKELIARIDAENLNRSPENHLTGIRIYNALTTKEEDGKLITHKDVFLIPVEKDMSDIVDVHIPVVSTSRTNEDPSILNATFPCPQSCP